jgi:photosystem II stability/assembly factor-like uncharacterized protein
MKKWVAGAVALVLAAGSAGAQWQRVEEVSSRSILSLRLVHGVMYAGADSLVYISPDGGTTWKRTALLSGGIEFIDAVTEHEGRLYAGTLLHGVFSSSDTGASWQQINTGLNALGALSITGFARRGPRLLAGTQGAGTYVLNPDKVSWSPFGELPLNTSGTVYSMDDTGDTLLVGAGSNGDVYRLFPDSTVWTETPFAGGHLRTALAFTWLGTELILAAGTGVYRSMDHGATWEFADSGFASANAVALCTVDSILYAAVNHLGTGLYLRSTDRGAHWLEDAPASSAAPSALVARGDTLFLGREDGLWFRVARTTAVDGRPALPGTITLHPNSPNPFNPSTEVRFDLPEGGYAVLRVYDVLGRPIATLYDGPATAGSHRARFLADGIASGVFIARLEFRTSRGNVTAATQKMLLLR